MQTLPTNLYSGEESLLKKGVIFAFIFFYPMSEKQKF